jgi:5-methylcytosine-specific restriction endonuclease McrA
MATYVIDAMRGLWRIDRDGPEDWNNIAVERPACPHCGHRETARLPLEYVVVDPTDQELAALDSTELDRFGLRKTTLRGRQDKKA